MLNENMPSRATQLLIYALVVVVTYFAVANMLMGNVYHPNLFFVALAGFSFFVVAKSSVIFKGKVISFGPSAMTPAMSNLYRFGYWLMFVGIISTFAGPII